MTRENRENGLWYSLLLKRQKTYDNQNAIRRIATTLLLIGDVL